MSNELDLWQYLEQREEMIVRKRKELLVELEALRKMRANLENTQHSKDDEDQREKLTIKEMIRNVLARNPEGGTSDQIIHWISQMHNAEVARTSLSPQLSRLKADAEVSLDEGTGKWSLTDPVMALSQRALLERSRANLEKEMQDYRPRYQSYPRRK